jgi:hypothetical protein
VAAASLVALQLFSGAAGAADTRLLEVTWSANTLVTTGGTTISTVTVANTDNQNLSHVRLGIGTAPASGALPAGVTVLAVGGADASFCSWSSSQVFCDFASIKARKSRSLQVIFSLAGAGSGLVTVPTAVSVNESGNPNGTNAQIFPGDLGLDVTAATCDLVATYFAPGQVNKNLNTGGSASCGLSTANPQSTRIAVPDGIVSAVFVEETNSTKCQAGYTCFGQLSTGDLANDGTYLVTWTIQWTVPTNFNVNKFGVIHFNDNGTFDFAIQNKNQNFCKNANSGDCFVSVNLTGTTLTAVIRTVGNGGMRGFG